MTVSKKRDVTEKETKDSDKCRLVTLEGFPSFKRIPNSIRVHQREATTDEVDGRFDLKHDRKKKGDLFGSILKKYQEDTKRREALPRISPHGRRQRKGVANSAVGRTPLLSKDSKQSQSGTLGAAGLASSKRSSARFSVDRASSRNLSLSYFPENLEQVVHSYREKYKNREWFDVDTTPSSISGRLLGDMSDKSQVTRSRNQSQEGAGSPNKDDPFDGGEVNPVKKKNPKAGMSQRQECHQAILRNKVHPNCQGCLRLLGEIVLDWQKSGKGDQREKKNAGGNVGKTHDLASSSSTASTLPTFSTQTSQRRLSAENTPQFKIAAAPRKLAPLPVSAATAKIKKRFPSNSDQN